MNNIIIDRCDNCNSLTKFNNNEFRSPRCVLALCDECGTKDDSKDVDSPHAVIGKRLRIGFSFNN
jgi:hypothetical protein